MQRLCAERGRPKAVIGGRRFAPSAWRVCRPMCLRLPPSAASDAKGRGDFARADDAFSVTRGRQADVDLHQTIGLDDRSYPYRECFDFRLLVMHGVRQAICVPAEIAGARRFLPRHRDALARRNTAASRQLAYLLLNEQRVQAAAPGRLKLPCPRAGAQPGSDLLSEAALSASGEILALGQLRKLMSQSAHSDA